MIFNEILFYQNRLLFRIPLQNIHNHPIKYRLTNESTLQNYDEKLIIRVLKANKSLKECFLIDKTQ